MPLFRFRVLSIIEQSFHRDGFPSNNNAFPATINWSNANYQVNQYIQRIQALEETITKLRIENAITETARSTLEKSYCSLIASTTTHQASETTDIGLQPTTLAVSLPSTTLLPQLKAEDYPLVRFWTEEKWQEWKQTPAGQTTSSKHTFLEDEQGQQLPESRVSAITTNMRDIWHEFHQHNIISTTATWITMPLIAKKTFRDKIARDFPEVKTAKQAYPSYKQTWITKKSDKKAASGSRRRKMSIKSDAVNTTDDTRATRDAKRRKTDDVGSPPSELIPLILATSNESGLTSSPAESSPSLSSNEPVKSASHSSCSSIRVPKPTPEAPNSILVSAPIVNIASRPSISSNGPTTEFPLPTKESVENVTNTRANNIPPVVPANRKLVVKLENPLETVQRTLPAVVNNQTTMPETSNDNTVTSNSQQVITVTPSKEQGNATLKCDSPATLTHSKAAARGKRGSATKKGWRPPSIKNGRSLCAHRWQKHIKSDGTRDELNDYYNPLSAEVKAKYKNEAAKLVADGIWINGTADVIANIATLDMHT